MANPKIYACNPGAWTITATGGEQSTYPLTSLQDFLRSSWWMSDATTDGQYVTIDLGAAAACDFAILEFGTSWDPTDVGWAQLTIEGADDAGMTTNKVQAYQGDPGSGTSLFAFASAYAKRYWRFTIGGTMTEKPGCANLFLGKTLAFSFPQEFGSRQADSSFQSVVGRSLSGTKRASQVVGGTRVFDMQFSLMSDAFAAEFRTFHDTVRGGLRPFYYSPDGGTTLYYVSLSKDYNPVIQYRPGQNNIQQLTMETADSEVV